MDATVAAAVGTIMGRPVSLPLGGLLIAAAAVAILVAAVLRSRSRLRRARFQSKSSEVRTGHLVEALAPLLDDFPVDVGREGTSTVFLGQPVDYLHFDPERGITFVEVKSGEARLSERQRRFRELVEAGEVRWATYRRR